MELSDINAEILSFSETIILSAQNTLHDIAFFTPQIFVAITVFLCGLLLGIFVEFLFTSLGNKIRLTQVWEKSGFSALLLKAGVHSSPSRLVGKFIKSIIVIFFLRNSMRILGFTEVEEFIGKIIILVPDILIALVILLFAIRAANTAGILVKNFVGIGDEKARTIMSVVAKNILIAFGVMAALVQVHIAEELVQVLFTALVSMLALGGGLALGLGGKDFVRDMISDFRKQKGTDGELREGE